MIPPHQIGRFISLFRVFACNNLSLRLRGGEDVTDMGSIQVKPQSEITENYVAGAGKAPAKYKKGIERTKDWKAKAIAGQGNYETAMRDERTLKRRAEKLEAVDENEWKRQAAGKGAERIGKGMIDAKDKQARGYAPVRAALDGMEIPDRTTDPDTNIDQRLKAVVHAQRRAVNKE